jgi:hypothetical protein
MNSLRGSPRTIVTALARFGLIRPSLIAERDGFDIKAETFQCEAQFS